MASCHHQILILILALVNFITYIPILNGEFAGISCAENLIQASCSKIRKDLLTEGFGLYAQVKKSFSSVLFCLLYKCFDDFSKWSLPKALQ